MPTRRPFPMNPEAIRTLPKGGGVAHANRSDSEPVNPDNADMDERQSSGTPQGGPNQKQAFKPGKKSRKPTAWMGGH